ncbi:hypothetical protein DID77_02855 [Candidatus Marinamargulisbacteria bacterium SCGC AG-439-L15]|nr:hypothetical protein DID77_02855 [Candidatus Marinamargulisbacteria bacterium SCGC AG-439-L15]
MKLNKVGYLGVLLATCSLLFLSACGDGWPRFKKIKTIAVVSISFSDELAEFNANGVQKEKTESVGASEALGVVGGLFSGKAGESVQNAAKKRNEAEAKTWDNALAFKEGFPSLARNAFKRNKIEIVDYEAMTDSVSFSNADVLKGLVAEAGADGITKFENTLGYVKEDKNFGLSKSYRLALKTKVSVADKEGYVGHLDFFIKAAKTRTTDGPVPTFTKADFESLQRQINSKLRSKVTEKRYAK